MAATGEQIAKMVGCSVSTVSRVLNNAGPVSDRSRKAILDAVAASGSVPRVLGPRSRSISRRVVEEKREAGLIDVVMIRQGQISWELKRGEKGVIAAPASKPKATDYFAPQNRYASTYFRHLADGVIEEVQRCGYRAVMQITEHLPENLISDESSSKGLVILGNRLPGIEDFIRRLNRPVVSFIPSDLGHLYDYVGIDNLSGISSAFDHLRQLGHTKIGYISANNTQKSSAFYERYAAYRLKLADAGLPLREDWVFFGTCLFPEDQAATEKILRLPDRPTALLCGYDGVALAAKLAADAVGLRVPTDLSIVGFDDQELAELFSPPLTTVRVPAMQMGRHAVQLLMMRLRHSVDSSDPCGLRVTPKLMIRQSTAPPPNTN